MAFYPMTNREFAEHEYKRKKQNAYADALVKEVRQLREENAELRAERDALKKCKILAVEQPIEPRGIVE